jgi:type II secretory pathway pseudopilin PulG
MRERPQAGLAVRLAAEFVVIVLGVLVALAADRWIQAVDEAQQETEYLLRLAVDLSADSAVLERASAMESLRVEWGWHLLDLLREVPSTVPATAETLLQIDWLHYGPALPSNSNTWDEILATGNLSLLQDEDLRDDLAAYYRLADFLEDIERTWAEEYTTYRAAAVRSLTPEQRALASRRYGDRIGIRLPGTTARQDLEREIEVDVGDARVALSRLRSHPDAVVGLGQVIPIATNRLLIYRGVEEQLLQVLDRVHRLSGGSS